MGRIKNAWELSKSSWQVLSKDRELIAIPIIAGVIAIVSFFLLASPALLSLAGADDQESVNGIVYIFFVLATIAATWISTFGSAAVICGAAQRMDGNDPTIGTSFAQARGHAVSLLGWATLATVVSIILDQLEERLGVLGNVVSWIAGTAFRVLSFLALPIIIFENVGAIEGFKRSSKMLKNTWGEQLAFNFGTGLLAVVAVIPGVLVGGAIASTGIAPLVALGVLVAVVWVVGAIAVFSALSAVFKAALYRHAVGLPVDPAFTPNTLGAAFGPR